MGTEVVLSVLKKKVLTGVPSRQTLRSQPISGEVERILYITEYLCDIAGFVEFPILVKETWPKLEKPKETLILHPDRNANHEKEQFEGEIAVHQLSREYPWEHVTAHESLSNAQKLMSVKSLDLKSLTCDDSCEGWVVYPTPNDPELDFSLCKWGERSHGNDGNYLFMRNRTSPLDSLTELFWNNKDRSDEYDKTRDGVMFGVYRDGILLDGVIGAPVVGASQCLPRPLIRINLSTKGNSRTNVSRTSLHQAKEWDKGIWEAIKNYIRDTDVASALELPAPTDSFG